MNGIDPSQVTIISLLISGISGLWVYFTKREAAREKEGNDASKLREVGLNERIEKKDALIINMVQESIKATTEVKNSIDNNTTAIKDSHNLTKQVLDELIRLKALNNR